MNYDFEEKECEVDSLRDKDMLDEDAELLSLAISRLQNSSEFVSKEEFFKELSIDEAELEDLPDIELE